MQTGMIVVTGLICASVFVNGWTDAPNAITAIVSTRVLSPKAAVGLAAVFNLLGVLLTGTAIAETISNMIILSPGAGALLTLAAALVSTITWAVGAWKFGIPTSESHALIAGLTGAALAGGGLGSVSWPEWQKVLLGLGISSVIGFLSGWLITLAVAKAFVRVKRVTANKVFSIGQLISSSAMAFSHGAQDGQKFIGIFAITLMLGGEFHAAEGYMAPLWVMVSCSALMALGTSAGGFRIIKRMGIDMVRIDKYQGFSAEIGASACMISAAVFGIPLSTTNTKGTAIMGAAAARRLSSVNWGIAKDMVLAWILTFPCCLLIGYLTALLFKIVFK